MMYMYCSLISIHRYSPSSLRQLYISTRFWMSFHLSYSPVSFFFSSTPSPSPSPLHWNPFDLYILWLWVRFMFI